MVGAIFVQYASWRWIFWLIAIIALPIAAACIYLIPATPSRDDSKVSQLDFVGVSTLTGEFLPQLFDNRILTAYTAAIILFVYALTTGSVSPWQSAGVLAPLFISVALVVAFFVWETRVDENNAAL
jgi:MFS family permease